MYMYINNNYLFPVWSLFQFQKDYTVFLEGLMKQAGGLLWSFNHSNLIFYWSKNNLMVVIS